MHETVARLLECAQHFTKFTAEPIQTLPELVTRMRISTAVMTNWKARGVSKAGALQAEKEFGCSAQYILTGRDNWMRSQHADEGSTVLVAQEVSLSGQYAGRIRSSVRVPVVGTLEMSSSGNFTLSVGPAGSLIGTVDAYSSSERAFGVRIFGDNLYPTARHGAVLVIEPDMDCVDGELVFIEFPDGSFDVCELVAVRPDAITTTGLNGGSRRTLNTSAIQTMHPVACIVAASKFTNA